MKPAFICPGAMKSATSTLNRILRSHPDIYLPRYKEPHFFDCSYERGLDWYDRKYFGGAREGQLAGDISPAYMFHPSAAERIHRTLGDGVKIFFLLRNPVDRAYSHYWMNRYRGLERGSFAQALQHEEAARRGNPYNRHAFAYIEMGRYARQIKPFLELFPARNLSFILFEEFIADTKRVIDGLLAFLGLPPRPEMDYFIKANESAQPKSMLLSKAIYAWPTRKITPRRVKEHIRIWNARPVKKPPMPGELRAMLQQCFAEDLSELEELIGRDLRLWRA